jgi:Obg family GTPase CgtA-like protein
MAQALAAEAPAGVAEHVPVLRPAPPRHGVKVEREDGAFRVEGDRVVAFAEMMPLEEEEARAELWRRFQRWGVTSALRRAGAKAGDRVLIGRREIELGARLRLGVLGGRSTPCTSGTWSWARRRGSNWTSTACCLSPPEFNGGKQDGKSRRLNTGW